jgi:hypothetical protein
MKKQMNEYYGLSGFFRAARFFLQFEGVVM